MSQPQLLAVGERYRLEHVLGHGGMGSVYQAHDRLTGQRVAIKIVPTERDDERPAEPADRVETTGLRRDGGPAPGDRASAAGHRRSTRVQPVTVELQALPRGTSALLSKSQVHISVHSIKSSTHPMWARMALAQEFRTLASLRHPHIISVLDYGFIAQLQPFFTMELLDNARSLSDVSKGLPLESKALLLVQLLLALSYLHRRGIWHRDLKPANVMVRQDGDGLQVKLLDFGLALTRSHAQAAQGDIAGTLSYMAPELFQGQTASAAADLFAFGVIAYELFTGRHPFDRGDDQELVAAILNKDPAWELLGRHAGLVSLLRRLLAKSPAARPSADEAMVALCAAVAIPVPQETAALRESTLQAAPFIGREEPMAVLSAALDAARAGAGGVRLLAGESGVGKTRLMEELRVYSLVRGVVSVRGQAVSEGGGAYGVWREILRTLCLGAQLDELSASVLKSILPDLEVLLERTIPDAPALNPQAAQVRLVHVIESLLLRRTTPLLLLLEDIHWADAESLALLQRVAPACRTRSILILASYRDDERPNLPQDLPGCAVQKLARLSAASIKELCRSMLSDVGYTPELLAFLEAETEGNVFFVIEVMRALAEEAGQLSLVASHRLPKTVLTGGIQAIVQRRLARLPAEVLPLLRLAAVAGRQLDLLILRRRQADLEPWLYMAADAAVLEVSDQSWRFAHDKIRESLLLELDPLERQGLHLELAHALESTYPGSAPHTATLAEHYQRGGSPAKAAYYRVEAGVHALSQGATEQAAAALQQALTPEARVLLPRTQAARAHNGLVQAQMAHGRFKLCIEAYEPLMELVGFPVPTGLLSMATAGSALLNQRWQRIRGGARLSDEDRSVASDVAHATRWAGEAYLFMGQLLQGIATVLYGAELADALGDTGLQSYFLATFSYLAGLIPLPKTSLEFLAKGRRVMQDQSNSSAALDFGRVATIRHMNAANWELAKSQLALSIALSRRVGDEYSLMYCLMLRFIVAFRQQDEEVFASVGSELYKRTQKYQGDRFRRTYPTYQGIKALRRGDLAAARRFLAEVESYGDKSQDVLIKVSLGGILALCLLRQGETAAARQRAEETLALLAKTRVSTELAGEGISAVTEVYLTLWESADAAERRQLDRPLRQSLSALRRCAQVFPSSAPRALLWHGRHAFNQGARGLALRLVAASRRSAQRLAMPFDEAQANTWLERFAQAPSGSGLGAELRGVFKLLTRGLQQGR